MKLKILEVFLHDYPCLHFDKKYKHKLIGIIKNKKLK